MTALSVSAAGLVCSLGIGSEQACASARAGLVRVSQVTTLNTDNDPAFAKETLDGVPLFVGHAAPVVGSGCTGLGKLLSLGSPALDELVRRACLGRNALSRTGLCVCLPDAFYLTRFGSPQESLGREEPPRHEDVRRNIAAQIADRLCERLDLPIPATARWVSDSGRLGLLSALQQASHWITAGAVDRCIVGSLDSLLEPAVLQACAAARVLKTAANPVGFMPGEAAAFLLLEAAGSDSGALQILSMSHARDNPYLDPGRQAMGRGTALVVRQALAAGGHADTLPGLLITDLNGTDIRAVDWGHALVHLRDQFGSFESQLWLPVDSFGETGASTGSVAICMALEAARRDRLPSATMLLVLSADDGGRGALVLGATNLRCH